MKPTATKLTTSALLLAATTTASAQSYVASPTPPASPGLLNEWLRQRDLNNTAWDIGAAVRLRYESKNNFGTSQNGGGTAGANDLKAISPNADNNTFMQRVKPHLGYTSEWFGFYVEGRGSYTSGDDRNPNPEADGPMDVHQAYVTLGNHKEFPLSLKVGRQELAYGDERLVGASDWTNLGRTFDAAKLRWQNKYFAADFFMSRLVVVDDNGFNTSNDYEIFSGVHASTKLIPKQTTDLYFLSRNVNTDAATVIGAGLPAFLGGPAARDIYTIGTRWKSLPGEFGPWDYTVELMGQFGHYNDPAAPVKGLEHEAYAAFAAAGYTWANAAWKPRVGLEYNFASGDSDPNDGKHGTFDNLFPTNHKFYGFMDLVSLQNIHNVRLTGSLKPLPRLTLTGDCHLFWLANTSDNFYTVAGARRGGIATTPGTGYGVNPNYSSYVGAELDVTASYALTGWSTLQGGYGHFFVGDYIKQSFSSTAVGATDANWFYLQLNLNF